MSDRRQVEPADLSTLRRWGAWDRVVSPAPLGELGQTRIPQPGQRRRIHRGAFALALFFAGMIAASVAGSRPTEPQAVEARSQLHHHR